MPPPGPGGLDEPEVEEGPCDDGHCEVAAPFVPHDPPLLTHSGLVPPCAPRGYKAYVTAEYLYWWMPNFEAPPLAVLGTPGGPALAVIGGGEVPQDSQALQGGRFTAGCWLNPQQTLALEGTFFFLGSLTSSQTLSSAGDPPLGRAFINAGTGAPDAVPVADPGLQLQAGSSTVETFARAWNGEVNLRKELCRACWGHVDLLAGGRYFQLDEHLRVTDRSTVATVPVFLSNADIAAEDFFGTRNQFFGGQLGLEAEYHWGRFFVDLWGKVALGNNRQTVRIDGSTVINAPPEPVGNRTLVGGVLAQPSNIGEYDRNQFAVLPELGVRVGWNVTDYLRLSGGYSFLYLSNVVRPGGQIDPVVDAGQIPQLFLGGTGTRPAFQFRDEDFWLHGPNVQVELRF